LLKFGLLCPQGVLFFLIGRPDQEKALVKLCELCAFAVR